ncbi:unnamed protein product [Protopolystoma xenopodis]|uniref:Uncharacterized protein n=1 Tax=Protopolystoma xenopodis TaxID=117903 RepID=A0A3S5CQ99_9PLAT|nr:unnamed protein product [Protopolystoma xenopodis]
MNSSVSSSNSPCLSRRLVDPGVLRSESSTVRPTYLYPSISWTRDLKSSTSSLFPTEQSASSTISGTSDIIAPINSMPQELSSSLSSSLQSYVVAVKQPRLYLNDQCQPIQDKPSRPRSHPAHTNTVSSLNCPEGRGHIGLVGKKGHQQQPKQREEEEDKEEEEEEEEGEGEEELGYGDEDENEDDSYDKEECERPVTFGCGADGLGEQKSTGLDAYKIYSNAQPSNDMKTFGSALSTGASVKASRDEVKPAVKPAPVFPHVFAVERSGEQPILLSCEKEKRQRRLGRGREKEKAKEKARDKESEREKESGTGSFTGRSGKKGAFSSKGQLRHQESSGGL